MDGVSLLAEAKAAGLAVWAEGDKLVIRGPRRAEALAEELLSRKGEILTLITRQSDVNVEALPKCDAEDLDNLGRRGEPEDLPDFAATACVCPAPIGPTGNSRCSVCELPLICPKCNRCRGCKLRLRFPQRTNSYE
jgi:hypothetical protein